MTKKQRKQSFVKRNEGNSDCFFVVVAFVTLHTIKQQKEDWLFYFSFFFTF